MRGRLRVLFCAGAALCAAGLGASSARAWTAQLPNPMDFGIYYEKLAFEAADTDGNNLISEGEFTRDAAAAFSGLDRNRDQKLTPDELGPHGAAAFARIDADGDGVLTFIEVMNYKMKAFRAADTDRDGSLSFDEMVNAVTSEVGK